MFELLESTLKVICSYLQLLLTAVNIVMLNSCVSRFLDIKTKSISTKVDNESMHTMGQSLGNGSYKRHLAS